jgi:lysyl-tRNA synthetase class 2
MSHAPSEQEQIRRKALEDIQALGINPYPAERFPVNANSVDILENYERDKLGYKNISLAGRIMSVRDMGKACFAELQDAVGRIQIYVRRDDICPGEDKTVYDQLFKKLLHLGDLIGITGYVFTTKMGEITIHCTSLVLLAKTLRPLPVVKVDEDGKVHDAFTDPEQRYRMRYLDLIVNPEVRNTFVRRTQMMNSIRQFLNNKGYLEVETPVLQPIHGGATARPFKTHHNTLDMDLYLRIANELYLKRLIVGGFDGVYEFAKDFRNEGMSRFHNPEFTQVELYVAYQDYLWMMDLVETMIEKVCMDVHGTTELTVGNHSISFARPWKRYTMYEAIKAFSGIEVEGRSDTELYADAKASGIHMDAGMSRSRIIDEIFGAKVEPNLIHPTFITDYPVEMSPLAKKHRTKEGLVERFEVVCNGKEIANAYSELNDPVDQRLRLEHQLELAGKGDEEAMGLDEDFLRALEFGMPPTAGLGIGIDRLAMILTNSASIQDVLFFPQMRPEKSL